MSATKAGRLVCVTLRNHEAVRVSARTRYRGTVFLGYFLWGEQQEVTRHSCENKSKEKLLSKIDWILAFASMTMRRGWITALGFGFLRRSTDYIHVVEDRYDED